MTESNILYLLIGITVLNVAMILWMEWKISKANTDIVLLRNAIVVLSKGLGELRDSLSIAEKNTISIHNILASVERLKDKIDKLDIKDHE